MTRCFFFFFFFKIYLFFFDCAGSSLLSAQAFSSCREQTFRWGAHASRCSGLLLQSTVIPRKKDLFLETPKLFFFFFVSFLF